MAYRYGNENGVLRKSQTEVRAFLLYDIHQIVAKLPQIRLVGPVMIHMSQNSEINQVKQACIRLELHYLTLDLSCSLPSAVGIAEFGDSVRRYLD